MTSLRQAVEEYMSLRRALGYKLHDVGLALESFLAFCDSEGAAIVTADLVTASAYLWIILVKWGGLGRRGCGS